MAQAPVDAPAGAPARIPGAGGPPAWLALLAGYLLSRLVVLAAVALTSTLQLSGARCGSAVPVRIDGFGGLQRCWDTVWFLRVAAIGYPTGVDPAHPQSTLAFFPAFPALIAAVSALGVPPLVAATGLAVLLGGGATLLVHRLGLALRPDRPDAALRGALLFCFFPGALVLSFGYSEALGAAAAAATLLLLHRRRWLPAGLAAALAGCTRADLAVAVCLAAWVAAALAIRRTGGRGPLSAAGLAPVGPLGFLGFLWVHTGSPGSWSRAQTLGWHQHLDWGTHAAHTVGRLATHPFRSASSVTQLLALLLLVGGVAALLLLRPGHPDAAARRLPASWLAYTGVLVALMLLSNQVGFRVRAELLMVPMFVAAGQLLRRHAIGWLLPAFAAAQALLVVAYLGANLIIPP